MFYIYNCDTEEYIKMSLSSLSGFVGREGTVFGNHTLQKRRLKIRSLEFGFMCDCVIDTRLIKYIVYDEFMNLVDYEILEQWANSKYWNERNRFKQLAYNRKRIYEFRRGPVPGIHNYGNCHYFRTPKTYGERRINCDLEHKKYVRSKRWLPDSYDDMKIASRDNKRSWKKNKKQKQWM